MEGSVNFITAEMADAVSKANGGTFGGNVIVDRKDGTASSIGTSWLTVGNSTAQGTDKNSKGVIAIYSKTNAASVIAATNVTANRSIELPDKDGTLALTSDLPTTVDYAITNSAHTTDAFKDVTVTVNNAHIRTYGKVLCVNMDFSISANVTLSAWAAVPIVDITNWDGTVINWANGAIVADSNRNIIGFLRILDNQVQVVAISSVTLYANTHILGTLSYIFT